MGDLVGFDVGGVSEGAFDGVIVVSVGAVLGSAVAFGGVGFGVGP